MSGELRERGQAQGGKTRKGSCWLRRALVEAAYGAARFRRITRRRGPKTAVGHSILTLDYTLLAHGVVSHEIGPTYLDERRRAQQRAVNQLGALSYEVPLTPAPPAA